MTGFTLVTHSHTRGCHVSVIVMLHLSLHRLFLSHLLEYDIWLDKIKIKITVSRFH